MENIKEKICQITNSKIVFDTFMNLNVQISSLKQDLQIKEVQINTLKEQNKQWSNLFSLQNQQLRNLEEQLKEK